MDKVGARIPWQMGCQEECHLRQARKKQMWRLEKRPFSLPLVVSGRGYVECQVVCRSAVVACVSVVRHGVSVEVVCFCGWTCLRRNRQPRNKKAQQTSHYQRHETLAMSPPHQQRDARQLETKRDKETWIRHRTDNTTRALSLSVIFLFCPLG